MNGSASWVGKIVRGAYLLIHAERAGTCARFTADVLTVASPLSSIKKMSGLIIQHAAPSCMATGSVTGPPNAALQPYAVPLPPCDASESKKAPQARLQSDLPPVSGEDGSRGNPWRKVDPTVTVCVFWLPKLIFLKASLQSGHQARAGRYQRPTAGAFLYDLLASPQAGFTAAPLMGFFACVSRWTDSEQSFVPAEQIYHWLGKERERRVMEERNFHFPIQSPPSSSAQWLCLAWKVSSKHPIHAFSFFLFFPPVLT